MYQMSIKLIEYWRDSNLGPFDLEASALPTDLYPLMMGLFLGDLAMSPLALDMSQCRWVATQGVNHGTYQNTNTPESSHYFTMEKKKVFLF